MKVLFEKKGPLAYVTINRPERLNACDGETYRMLTEVWHEFHDDPALRVGILTGAGERAFCVGTDVKANDFARLSEEPHNLPFSLLSATSPNRSSPRSMAMRMGGVWSKLFAVTSALQLSTRSLALATPGSGGCQQEEGRSDFLG